MATDNMSMIPTNLTQADGLLPNFTSIPTSPTVSAGATSLESLILLSLLFSIIGLVGVVGNLLVMYVIVSDKTMRRSVTNLLILNLALADLLIMLFGVVEIVQFEIDRGWLLGGAICRINRYILVLALYVSIMTLVAVCVERYIAIVHPIKAHIFCSRTRTMIAIGVIWPMALLLALPIVIYNQVGAPPGFPRKLCAIRFPNHAFNHAIYRYLEFVCFFLGPVVLQSVLYAVICRRLFSGAKELHRKHAIVSTDGATKERDSDTIKARKGVVKMLIASVLVYFVSYAPAQIPLIYNTFAKETFKPTWPFHVLLMILGYINSAANPVLYAIFSQKFRTRFKMVFCRCFVSSRYRRGSNANDSYAFRSTNIRYQMVCCKELACGVVRKKARRTFEN